jgi:hypothetical protein
MGLLLHADPQLAPAPGDSFIVTDGRLLICALSQGAERLFCRSEPSVIHRPVSDLLVGVADEGGLSSLAMLLTAAAEGTVEVTDAVVATVEGGREHHSARLGPCGPPAAALLLIDDAVV